MKGLFLKKELGEWQIKKSYNIEVQLPIQLAYHHLIRKT